MQSLPGVAGLFNSLASFHFLPDFPPDANYSLDGSTLVISRFSDSSAAIKARPPVVGIVGGIGAGKSALTRFAAEQMPLAVVDGDVVGHEALRVPELKTRVVEAFSGILSDPSTLLVDGEINRKVLGALIWGSDPVSRQRRSTLEKIVHPWMVERFKTLFAQHRQSGQCDVIIFDAAILLEAGWDQLCDSIFYIETTDASRLERVQQQRSWNNEQLRIREESQWPLETKKSRAKLIINNNQPLSLAGRDFVQALQQLAARSSKPASSHVPHVTSN